MTILLHNTNARAARRILRTGRINANVERFRPYDHLSGPFFFLEGQDGSEVRSSGVPGDVTLRFACNLPIVGPLDRAAINRAINTGAYGHLRGKIVVGRNDVSKAVEQAIIIPDQRAFLALVDIESLRISTRLGLLAAVRTRRRLFDVLLLTTE